MSTTRRTDGPQLADADLEQLSAWLDGELEPEQDRAIFDRLKSDAGLRAQFEWFNLAGDALRSHEVAACDHPRLVDRVCEALKSEPVRIGPGALSGSRVGRYLATGITVAAAAAMLAVVAVPQLRGTDAVPAAPPAVAMGPAGTEVPRVVKAPPARQPQLDAYLRAHRELAATGVMPSAVAYIRGPGEPDR
jgi:negative regulator of sigma E activity